VMVSACVLCACCAVWGFSLLRAAEFSRNRCCAQYYCKCTECDLARTRKCDLARTQIWREPRSGCTSTGFPATIIIIILFSLSVHAPWHPLQRPGHRSFSSTSFSMVLGPYRSLCRCRNETYLRFLSALVLSARLSTTSPPPPPATGHHLPQPHAMTTLQLRSQPSPPPIQSPFPRLYSKVIEI